MKYFLHSVDSMEDEKLTILFREYGYEGTGLFFAILEKLAKQEKPVSTSVLKYQLKVGKRLEKCWNFMESLGIISSNNGDTFNKQLLNYAETYVIKKEKNAKKVSEWREKQKDAENVTGYVPVSNLPKVKESKVNKSKLNEIKEKESKEKELKVDGEEKTPSVYSSFISIYNDFILKLTSAPAKINGMQGKAAKEIIAYLHTACKNKNPAAGDAEILESWRFILVSFDKWDPFHRRQTNLNQINSNIVNIVASIRNGSGNTSLEQSDDTFRRLAERDFGPDGRGHIHQASN